MADWFSLYCDQVPHPPRYSDLWADWLRWMICVMDHDDDALPFVASILSHALKVGLTERQGRAILKVQRRTLREYEAGVLNCQSISRPETERLYGHEAISLAETPAKGRA